MATQQQSATAKDSGERADVCTPPPVPSPWWTAAEAARYLRVGVKLVYREAQSGRLRSARVGGRRQLFLCREWCDQWVLQFATPVEVRR